MRARHALPRVSCLLLIGLLSGIATPVFGASECNTCQDLCKLMDYYQQRQKGVELWQKYVDGFGRKIPHGVTDMTGMENQFWGEMGPWLESRPPEPGDAAKGDLGMLPCAGPVRKPKPPPGAKPPSSDAGTIAATNFGSCKVYASKTLLGTPSDQEIEDNGGPVTDAVVAAFNCKPIAESTIAHERVHAQDCKNAYGAGHSEIIDHPIFTAMSELDAWKKERDMLHDAILNIVRGDKNQCGWIPTTRQRADSNSIPSLKQTQCMFKRAWAAASALSGGAVTPPAGSPGACDGGTP